MTTLRSELFSVTIRLTIRRKVGWMTLIYTIRGMAQWADFRDQPAADSWTGQGTITDPWVIAPVDDVWGWFTACVGPHTQHPWEVSLEVC